MSQSVWYSELEHHHCFETPFLETETSKKSAKNPNEKILHNGVLLAGPVATLDYYQL